MKYFFQENGIPITSVIDWMTSSNNIYDISSHSRCSNASLATETLPGDRSGMSPEGGGGMGPRRPGPEDWLRLGLGGTECGVLYSERTALFCRRFSILPFEVRLECCARPGTKAKEG